MLSTVHRRSSDWTLKQGIVQQSGWTWNGPDRARRDFHGSVLEVSLDGSGWLTAAMPLAPSRIARGGNPAGLDLLGAHSQIKDAFRFGAGAPSLGGGVLLLGELCLRDCERDARFESIFRYLESGMARGLQVFRGLAGGDGRTPPEPSVELASGNCSLEALSEEIEGRLRETERDWERRPGPCDFVIRRDLEEYFQKIVVTSDDEAISFRSPLTGMQSLTEPSVTAVSNFLLAANGMMRMARASLVHGASPDWGAERQEADTGWIVLEVVVPRHCWRLFSVDRIVGSLLVGARLTWRETRVLFDEGAARRYLEIY